ncbi:hypothetical protein GCM10010174_74840 [Kutzneria viridogrisea]|uniref:Membrane protein n=2 Tax=Kutzneria TaxID=43356 RepID=A0ABR6BMZ1_9PSEU|nr:DoxX family protein [Kutzneria albida]AHH96512.1 putative secreted protein [Kutzneria albida DSM 43870]MBA8928270.1 putative membrane protein [Kutzneria viridogrisea]
MAPVIALVGGFVLLRLTGLLGVAALDAWPPALRGGVALMFLLTGVAHFVPKMRADMIAMVPPRLPSPALLVTVTGVLELAGALGVLVPATAGLAAWCLTLLLLVMFPANVSAARRGLEFGGRPATPLVPRTLEQALFLAATIAAAVTAP